MSVTLIKVLKRLGVLYGLKWLMILEMKSLYFYIIFTEIDTRMKSGV